MKKKYQILLWILILGFSKLNAAKYNEDFFIDSYAEDYYTDNSFGNTLPSSEYDYLFDNPFEDYSYDEENFTTKAAPGGNPIGVTPIGGKELFIFPLFALLYIAFRLRKVNLKQNKQ